VKPSDIVERGQLPFIVEAAETVKGWMFLSPGPARRMSALKVAVAVGSMDEC
jgi:hypothetical protein